MNNVVADETDTMRGTANCSFLHRSPYVCCGISHHVIRCPTLHHSLIQARVSAHTVRTYAIYRSRAGTLTHHKKTQDTKHSPFIHSYERISSDFNDLTHKSKTIRAIIKRATISPKTGQRHSHYSITQRSRHNKQVQADASRNATSNTLD